MDLKDAIEKIELARAAFIFFSGKRRVRRWVYEYSKSAYSFDAAKLILKYLGMLTFFNFIFMKIFIMSFRDPSIKTVDKTGNPITPEQAKAFIDAFEKNLMQDFFEVVLAQNALLFFYSFVSAHFVGFVLLSYRPGSDFGILFKKIKQFYALTVLVTFWVAITANAIALPLYAAAKNGHGSHFFALLATTYTLYFLTIVRYFYLFKSLFRISWRAIFRGSVWMWVIDYVIDHAFGRYVTQFTDLLAKLAVDLAKWQP